MRKNTFMQGVAIVVLCVLLDIVLHVVTSAYSTMPDTPTYSAVAEVLGTEISATLWALLAFSSVAYVFYRFQDRIPGRGLTKGLRYGSAIALLWLFAMLEGVALFDNPVINEFVVGLSDATPVFVLCILLSLLIGKNEAYIDSGLQTIHQKLLTVSVFSIFFLLGRYAAYFSGAIQSGYQTSPYFTFIWTLLMGIHIGILCVVVGQAARTSSLNRSAVRFGLGIFGINWGVFLVFMPLMFDGYLIDVLRRFTLDVLLVTGGYYLASRWRFLPLGSNPTQGDDTFKS